ncbi:MAG: hypothetical protein ACUVQP_03700 [Bacteroidales bacterium]
MKLSNEQLEWLDIYGSWVNAQSMRVIFWKYACPEVIVNPIDPVAARKALKLHLEVIIMNGKNLMNLEDFLKGKEATGTVITSPRIQPKLV